MSLNKNKKAVLIGVGLAFALSITMAWIMAQNYKVDVNKDRYKLTKDYAEAKDQNYTYNHDNGRSLYQGMCSRCHGDKGQGVLGSPPLKDALLLKDSLKTMKVIVFGLNGEISREGKTYNSLMPPFKMMKHKDLADVTNFIRKEFANQTDTITPVNIIETKIDFIQQAKPFLESEL